MVEYSREDRRQKIRDDYAIEDDEIICIPAELDDNSEAKTKLKVCAYCRVSTDDPDQTSSYELQKAYFEDMINEREDWEFAGIYADEGISATSLKHRDQFLLMIEAAKRGEINLIVTKELSRFSRNVLDTVRVIRELQALNPPVWVFFEGAGLNTRDKQSEFVLTVLAAVAQEESRGKSNSMNWSLERRFKRGRFLTPVLLGYDHDENGDYVINEEEAITVRLIYYLYLSGSSIAAIADILTKLGRCTKRGKSTWSSSSIRQILRNERNCGDVLAWKTYTYDFWEHKKCINRKKRPQFLKKNHHVPIVSRDTYEVTQLKMKLDSRSRDNRPLPTLSVIREGILSGFVLVDINKHAFTLNDYKEASLALETQMRIGKQSEDTLRGFRLISSTNFNINELPTLSIGKGITRLNSEVVKRFVDCEAIELLFNPIMNVLVIRACATTHANAISISGHNGENFDAISFRSGNFEEVLCSNSELNAECVYKFSGEYIENDLCKIMVFDLENPVCFKNSSSVCYTEKASRKILMNIDASEMKMPAEVYKVYGDVQAETMDMIQKQADELFKKFISNNVE